LSEPTAPFAETTEWLGATGCVEVRQIMDTS